jgi:hypothetical protein
MAHIKRQVRMYVFLGLIGASVVLYGCGSDWLKRTRATVSVSFPLDDMECPTNEMKSLVDTNN